jgi:signal transduction histidine kinase
MEHGTPWDLELPLVTATGQAIWVRSQGDVEFEDQRPVRLIGAIQNITEHRRRRLELLQEQELRLQLEAQMQQTERLLRERSDMLDVMAHEVRQPLNNASAAMQSAALALGGLDEQRATPRLMRAQAVLAQVLASIDNTLAVAALLARPDPIARADTDIDALLSVAVADISLPQRLRIRIERLTGTRTASMDMSLMRLALRNLLNNALQHSPPDSPVVLRVADSDEPLALLLDVVDAGGGIAADLVPRLFKRATHRGRRRAQSGQGHGLGLYIVRRVMELHAGTVQVQANSVQGVTMRLVINQPHGD